MTLRPRLSPLLLVALAVLMLAGCNGIVRFGELDPPPGELVVVDVDIEGNDQVGEGDLIEGLFTHADWATFQDPQPLLEREELPTDVERVEALYARQGHFEARVVDVRLVPRSEDTVEVVFVVEEGEPTTISTLEFEGFAADELAGEGDAARRLRSVADEVLDLAELEPGDVWTEEAHEATEAAIAQALQELGFVYAEVNGRAFVDRDERRAAVVYQIDHGPLVRIGSTEVEGQVAVDSERILERAGVAPGTIATPDALERIEERVFDLGNFFFVRAHLRDPRAHALSRDPDALALDEVGGNDALAAASDAAEDHADATAPANMMEMREVGIEHVQAETVDTRGDESRLRDDRPRGDEELPVDTAQFDDGPQGDEERLRDEELLVDRLRDEELLVDRLRDEELLINAAQGEVIEPLVIELQEQPFNELTGGVGGTIGANRSDVHLSFGYENLDFLGGLRKLDVELRPELVFLSQDFGGTESMAPGGRARVVFRQPGFLEEMLELRGTATYDLQIDYGYQLHHLAGQPRLSRKFLRYLEVYLAYNIEYFQYFAIADTFDAPTRELLGFAFRESYLISGLEQGLTFDLRDDVLDPQNGFYAATTVTEALTALGSDFEYYRVLGDLRGYLTFWEPLTLASRIKLGRVFTASPDQDVPLAARFRGGGPNDMRGFGYDRMGPSICLEEGRPEGRILEDGVECDSGVQDQVFVGGNLLVEASFETRWKLPVSLLDYPLGLVAFLDVGEVFDTVGDFASSELHVAVGPGVRWLTPVGPVRFDLGILLTGPIAPSPELHFSIGQAF